MTYSPVTNDDVQELRAFLSEADLTIAGLDSTAVRVWVERDHDGEIVGSTGYETSTDGADVLIRSVAVSSTRRAAGAGTRLARFALEEAASLGARRGRGSSHADRGPSGRSSDSARLTGANSLPCCPARSKYASLPKPVSSSGQWRGCATSQLSAPHLAALPGRRSSTGRNGSPCWQSRPSIHLADRGRVNLFGCCSDVPRECAEVVSVLPAVGSESKVLRRHDVRVGVINEDHFARFDL